MISTDFSERKGPVTNASHEIGHSYNLGRADDDFFGWSVALDGATALIGAWRDADPNGDNAGAAYVFNLG